MVVVVGDAVVVVVVIDASQSSQVECSETIVFVAPPTVVGPTIV